MWSAVTRIYSLILAAIVFFTALFTTGELPKNTAMPDTLPGEYGQWVDPFIGTGGLPWVCAMLFPGATTPFGMVRLSPDTSLVGGSEPFKMGMAGYYYPHTHILGFSHTRLSGTGAKDLGHFRVTPGVGNVNPLNRLKNPLIFSHDKEVATAGYYAVNLPGIDCLAELTATTHVGAHRYTFGSSKDAHLILDATSFLAGGRAEEGVVRVNADAMEIEGEGRVFTSFSGRYDGLKGYFVAQFDTPFASYATWSDGELVQGQATAAGNDTGVDINFGNIKGRPVELKIGISFVSPANARQNLQVQAGGLDFEGIRNQSRDEWDEWLSRIKIDTDDDDIRTIFYTALYHSMIMPTNFTDVNGQYLGFEHQVGLAEDFTYRTDMSIWDTFRTLHPLLNLIAPDVQRDCLKSLVRMGRIGGTLPRWPSGAGYTGSMFGTPSDMVVAESYLKGITDFEVEEAYAFMKRTSDGAVTGRADNRGGIEEYNAYGYCPADLVNLSVSRTLEYAWADASIALLADALGKPAEAAHYREKSMNYKNIFNPRTNYFHARNADGSWQKVFVPQMNSYFDEILPKNLRLTEAYCEGSPQHWRWSVPQDPQGMIELFGRDTFVRELDTFMRGASANRAAFNPGSAYWHGNQHDIHALFLFNDAGRPELTQKWARWALAERHSTDVDGLDGNDDGGTLSAWYVLAAMGLYPVAGTDRYWLASPNLHRAEADLGNGGTLIVEAMNQSAENIYVQSVTLNGTRLTAPFLTHGQIAQGGRLVFVMGPSPAANGGY